MTPPTTNMSGLRPLQLPLMVEKWRKQEEEAEAAAATASIVDGDTADDDGAPTYYHDVRQNLPTAEPTPSELASPLTPTFSTRGYLRYSSSMSSFELSTPASCEGSPSSPTQALQTTCIRTLENVKEEEPFEDDRFDNLVLDELSCDDVSEHFDLYDCLCDEPCMHRDSDLVRSATSFFSRSGDVEYDLGCISDGDSPFSQRLPRRKHRDTSTPPFVGLSHRIGSRLPSFARWKSPRKSSVVNSPEMVAAEHRSVSRAASSRSSSVSRSNRRLPDRSTDPALPPTPALSYFGSCDSITCPGPLDVEQADQILSSIRRDRAQATTPLLPPLMTRTSADHETAQPSPLQSPKIASRYEEEPHSPLVLSPPLSTRPSISSFSQIIPSGELPPIPAPDAWSDLLGHANFTILPVPYKPESSTLSSLRELRADWETARVNYTKHLVRTGEHYGLTSKTYAYTEQKWADTDRAWRRFHDETVDALVASGQATSSDKFDEGIITAVPIIDGEGKFPERGDEDIVGPMVREAAMTLAGGSDRRRPSFWRNLTDLVGLRK
ncbi:hypothetical protein F5Y17DRAFT_12466 [Xylariaceae sp. FL0594]|nr:hypothetical protein F5Y17DRAFT_12466 [Xylariaceae sp. FL0594]